MKTKKCKKLACNLHDKKGYVVHIRALKQVLIHGLIFKKVHTVILLNQESWLKPYIEENTKSKNEANNDLDKYFFKLMNYSIFGKTMENLKEHRNFKLVTTDKKRNKLVWGPNYHTTKWFSEDLLTIEMKKIKVKMNKPVYLGLSVLEISKTWMYEFWYDYIKPKYQNNAKLCYMDTDSFIVHIKPEDFYKDISDDVKKRYDASDYKFDRPLAKEMNKTVTDLMKDEPRGNIITEFVALRPKTYSYLTNDDKNVKKAKGTNMIIKIAYLRMKSQ